MALPKILGAQRDFSAGELDVSMKRSDDNPIMKAGARQMSNWRIKNSKSVKNRPGRLALFLESGRVEEILMSSGNTFYLAFGNGYLKVYNAAGAQVFTTTKKGDGTTNIPWTTATFKNVVWDVYKLAIYITYGDDAPLNVPQVLTWDGVSQTSTWTLTTYAEDQINPTGRGQKRTPFYRLSPLNITLKPGDTAGSGVTVTASSAVFVAGMIGTRLRFCGRQMLITAVPNSTHATVTIEETLPGTQAINVGSNPTSIILVGQIVVGSVSGASGIVTSSTAVPQQIIVQLLGNTSTLTSGAFVITDQIVGPTGGVAANSVSTVQNPEAVAVWDDEVMNAFRGYPRSVFVDQGRLGFCDFPALPQFIAWSAIGIFTDIFTDTFNAGPDNSVQEIVPGKSRVLFVVPGTEASEFVFCDNAVYYIPITPTNPLKPGSVAFNLISKDGSAQVQPRIVQDVILWINAGQTGVFAIVATGAYNRPYEPRNISELHAHLFNTPVAIAAPSTTSQFEERYVYVLNTDGTVAVGKYNTETGQIKGIVGWLPGSGAGTVNWLSALAANVLFSTSYAPNGITAVGVVEQLDSTQYLDAAMFVNAAPTAFAPPLGKGPLWWLPSGTVDLMDQSTRMMGTYTIDANGNIIPQNNGGENLLAATLVAGQTWTSILEPFVPDAAPGQSVGQRMKKRRVSWFAVYVIDSTGLLLARLFAGPLTRTSPALGAIVNQRRVSTWNQDDDPTAAPPLREEVQRWRPLGRAFDPRVCVIKDTPGPLEIPEITIEASI